MSDAASLLAIVLDTNPAAYTVPVSRVVASILVFVNAHLACNNLNRVAIVAAHPGKAQWLYPSVSETEHTVKRPFSAIQDDVLANLELRMGGDVMLAGALTLALSYVNRISTDLDVTDTKLYSTHNTDGSEQKTQHKLQSRILVISVSDDASQQYIPIMNCIFAAQRKKIPIDVCKLNGETSFLQQAADATSGIFMPCEPNGLLQYLMMYLPDPAARQHLVLPSQANVDYRTACFCHKRVIDVGFVCSICLSIFCSPSAICLTCGSNLSLQNYGGRPAVVKRKKKVRESAAPPRAS